MQGERSAKCETKFYDFVLPGAQPNSYFEVAEPLRYGAMIENEDAIHRYWLQGLAYRVGDSASVHLQGGDTGLLQAIGRTEVHSCINIYNFR